MYLLQNPFTYNLLFEVSIMMTSPPTHKITLQMRKLNQKLWLIQVHWAKNLEPKLDTRSPYSKFHFLLYHDATSRCSKVNCQSQREIWNSVASSAVFLYMECQTPGAAWVPPTVRQSSQLLYTELGPSNLTPYKIPSSECGTEKGLTREALCLQH